MNEFSLSQEIELGVVMEMSRNAEAVNLTRDSFSPCASCEMIRGGREEDRREQGRSKEKSHSFPPRGFVTNQQHPVLLWIPHAPTPPALLLLIYSFPVFFVHSVRVKLMTKQ